MGNNPNPKNPEREPSGKDQGMPRVPQPQQPREGDVKRREQGNAPKEEKSPNPRQG